MGSKDEIILKIVVFIELFSKKSILKKNKQFQQLK